MSGAIMPLPLAMPVMRTCGVADLRHAGRRLGKGVGGHDAARRRFPGILAQARVQRRQRRGQACRAAASRRSRRWRRRTPAAPGSRPASPRASAVAAQASRPARPVNTLALPAFTTTARARPPLQRGPAPVDRRTGAFVGGEDAGDRGAGRQLHHHQVVAPLVANAGGRGAQAHARQWRQFGQLQRQAVKSVWPWLGPLGVSSDGWPVRGRRVRCRCPDWAFRCHD